MVRRATDRADLIKRTIVNCGLGDGASLPCWFSGDAQVSLSDGVREEHHAFSFLRGNGIDSGAPLRDVAVARGQFWLLTASPPLGDGHRVGGPLVLVTDTGQEIGRLSAPPPFRLILTATDTNCLLLDAGGEVLEVGLR